MFGGHGVPAAKSAEAFSARNNAWIVVCVGSNTPSETPFLISRNVYVGPTACATSKLVRVPSPIRSSRSRNQVTVITRGGGCYTLPLRSARASDLFPDTNTTYEVLYP
jgi:hypothetical protein